MSQQDFKSSTTQTNKASTDKPENHQAKDKVFWGVIEGLYSGEYVPGQRLLEPDLVRQYGVSRGSVREALNRLSAEGVIVLHPHRGATIKRLSRKETRDILEVVELLVGLAARRAAANINKDHARKLWAAYEACAAVNLDWTAEKMIKTRNSFYRTLNAIGDNGVLIRLLPAMHIHLVRAQFRAFYDGTQVDRLADYGRIVEAVQSSDPRRAELAGRRLIRKVAVLIDSLPDSTFAPPSG